MAKISSIGALEQTVEELGFLPFFRCSVPGFSLEERIDRRFWFPDRGEGAWEWRMAIAEKGGIAYAKLFAGKAGFVSHKWYPRFANFRRAGYDFDARCDEGLVPRAQRLIMDAVAANGPSLTRMLREKAGKRGFESALTALQMQCYLTIRRFEYAIDRYGRPYGWGLARYDTPEAVFGEDFVRCGYGEPPQASYAAIFEQLAKLCPQASEKQLAALLGKPPQP